MLESKRALNKQNLIKAKIFLVFKYLSSKYLLMNFLGTKKLFE